MNEHLQSIDTITSKVHIISLSDISKRDFLRWAAGLSITPNQDFQDEAADEASHLQETSIFQPHRSSFQGSCSHSCSQSGKTSTLLETCTSTLIYSYGTDEIQSGNHAYDTGHSSPLTGSEVFIQDMMALNLEIPLSIRRTRWDRGHWRSCRLSIRWRLHVRIILTLLLGLSSTLTLRLRAQYLIRIQTPIRVNSILNIRPTNFRRNSSIDMRSDS